MTLNRIREHVSYANVMATIAVFIALCGGAYAAVVIAPKNSVVSRSIKNGQVRSADVKDNNLTGRDINESSLVLPAPELPAPEAWHEVGTAGEPPFQNGYTNFGGAFETVAFYKDALGVVHLKGIASGAGPSGIFQLPAGYRPADGKELDPPAVCGCTVVDSNADEVNVRTGRLHIFGDFGSPAGNGLVSMEGLSSFVSLDGVTFRGEG